MSEPQKTRVQIAFDTLEHAFTRYKASAEGASNRHPAGDPARAEADFSEQDKAHLQLLRAKLDVALVESLNETIKKSAEAGDKLGGRVLWLNVILVLLTAAIAGAALGELFQ